MAYNRLYNLTQKLFPFPMSPAEDLEPAIDQESEIGSAINDNNNNERNSPNIDDDLGGRERSLQALFRGDRILGCNEPGRWSFLMNRKKNPPFIIGSIVLNKEQTMSVKWEDGETEKLQTKSDLIAYADRLFVLDRECLTIGSRVLLADHTDIEGTILQKRYLVTGSCVEDPNVIFTDIDAHKIQRHSHGNGYKDLKILYKGWFGITCGHRIRVHLRALEDDVFFSCIVDSGHKNAEVYFIGKEVKIGLSMLWDAQWVNISTAWLSNSFKYYNTYAVVTDIEIEELDVYWFGKAKKDPKKAAVSSDSDMSLTGAPDRVILYEDLQNTKYLTNDPWYHMPPNSLWKYKPSQSDAPISKDSWVSKWLKVLDWDRWEYPVTGDAQELLTYANQDIILKIQYIRSVVDVHWDNGNEATLSSADVIPLQVGSVWSDVLQLHPGSIVANLLDFAAQDKYGMLLSVDNEMIATVKWITSSNQCDPEMPDQAITSTTVSSLPLYSLVEKKEYDYVSRVNNCPLVISGGRFEVGVVQGVDTASGQVRVSLPDGANIKLFPHELVHYNCDVLFCPKEGAWMTWYDHIIPPTTIVFAKVAPEELESLEEESDKLNESVCLDLSVSPKNKLEGMDNVPEDNIFFNEDMLPRMRETHFRRTVEDEVVEMKKSLPDGMWLEFYTNRGDIMSTIMVGPNGTIFEDFLFIFDIFLMENFPDSDPYINFRSMGISVYPRHFCKTGAVFLPEETRIPDEEFSNSYIMNVLLEIKDFMGMPFESVLQKDYENLPAVKREGPEELHKFLLLSLIDYSIALLRKPPKTWRSVINHHFSLALPRIIERYKNGQVQLRKATSATSVSNEKGDIPKLEEFELVTIPWSDAYTRSIEVRVEMLQEILDTECSPH